MQGIEARAAASVFAGHLADDNLRIRVNVQLLCFERDSALQSFHQRRVFGDVVVLVTDPLGDTDWAILAATDDHTDA